MRLVVDSPDHTENGVGENWAFFIDGDDGDQLAEISVDPELLGTTMGELLEVYTELVIDDDAIAALRQLVGPKPHGPNWSDPEEDPFDGGL